MRIGLGDDSLPADPGAAQAVSDWVSANESASTLAALNAGVYLPTSSSAVAAPTFAQWLSANSAVIVAGCALIGVLIAVGEK